MQIGRRWTVKDAAELWAAGIGGLSGSESALSSAGRKCISGTYVPGGILRITAAPRPSPEIVRFQPRAKPTRLHSYEPRVRCGAKAGRFGPGPRQRCCLTLGNGAARFCLRCFVADLAIIDIVNDANHAQRLLGSRLSLATLRRLSCRGSLWLKSRFNYVTFKVRQYRRKAKARRNDPDIYPLW